MTPEAQRIAIAEACGWTAIPNHGGAGGFIAKMPNGTTLWDNCLGGTVRDAIDANCPGYLDDLNAMHEAEKVLDTTNGGPKSGDCLRYAYSRELYKLCPEWIQPFRAPANIRAEAFLRTLNLWKDEP